MTTLDTAPDTTGDIDLEEPAETDDVQADDRDASPQTPTLPLASLAPHPDNPRSDLGDLKELERSIKANGVLVPLLVLPPDAEGVHLIVAGHRRHAAARRVGVVEAPVVVRAMTRIEVIEAMLSENVNRDALTVGDEVRAVEALMSLDGALTPAKLCRRIGKSQAWVRARLAVTILPEQWRSAIDTGALSLAAAEAASSAADMGPEHLDAICARLASHRWGDPGREVEDYRRQVRRQAEYTKAVESARRSGTVYTDDDSVPKRAKRLDNLFSGRELRDAHADEPCHATVIKPATWGDGTIRNDICTEPNRHSAKRVESGKGSTLAIDRVPRLDTESANLKRKGRLARLAHAAEYFARSRGGPSQSELVRLAMLSLVREAGRDAVKYAATILGHERTNDVDAVALLRGVETPSALARVAGAVACGLAEDDMYWASNGAQCIAWVDLLCQSGWTPDPWTAVVIEQRDRRLAPAPNAEPDSNDDGDDEVGSFRATARTNSGTSFAPPEDEPRDQYREAPGRADSVPPTRPTDGARGDANSDVTDIPSPEDESSGIDR